MDLLLTRTPEDSAAFAARLEAACPGRYTPLIAPLLRIVPMGEAPDLAGVHGLIFTSRRGVARFGSLCARRDLPALCVGPATTEAARALGLDAEMGGADAAHLFAHITALPPRAGVWLHLHGAERVRPLAEDLSAAGHKARGAVLYRQETRAADPRIIARLAEKTPLLVPLFSPRAAKRFAALLDQHPICAPLDIIAISEATAAPIARHARRISVAQTPDAKAMLAACGAFE